MLQIPVNCSTVVVYLPFEKPLLELAEENFEPQPKMVIFSK